MMMRKDYTMAMLTLNISLSVFFVCLVAACSVPDDNSGTLSGTVLLWEGDFMPGNPTGTKTPVVRDIFIYEPTSIDEVTQAHEFPDPFYSDIQTKLVGTTTSDTNGHFSLPLTAGRYSLFVQEDGHYYSNLTESNIINPVNIISGATTTVDIDITNQAAF
jgi:hypothetical protein